MRRAYRCCLELHFCHLSWRLRPAVSPLHSSERAVRVRVVVVGSALPLGRLPSLLSSLVQLKTSLGPPQEYTRRSQWDSHGLFARDTCGATPDTPITVCPSAGAAPAARAPETPCDTRSFFVSAVSLLSLVAISRAWCSKCRPLHRKVLSQSLPKYTSRHSPSHSSRKPCVPSR